MKLLSLIPQESYSFSGIKSRLYLSLKKSNGSLVYGIVKIIYFEITNKKFKFSHYKIIITFVNDRFPFTEVREGGKFRNTILFGEPLVVDFNKVDAERVSVIVYLF